MTTAFATFDEPFAWLLRGLIEYGWLDISRQHLPAGSFGGIQLAPLLEQEGRGGLVLQIPAVAGAQHAVEDGSYDVQVVLSRGSAGGLAFFLRCPEANYFQEFPYDPANPSWAAGYIHQALTEYVPQFVEWRLAGGEVTWAQRAGIPEVEGEPSSYVLLAFLRDRVQTNRPLHVGPAEGWWLGAPPPAAVTPQGAAHTPVPSAPIGAIATVGRGGEPVLPDQGPAFSHGQALAAVSTPSMALLALTTLGFLQGGLWLLNAATVVIWYREDWQALIISLPLAILLFAGGFLSMLGARRYKTLGKGPLPWLSMAYVALVPICCIGGLPVAIWAALTWNKPIVKDARQSG